MSKHRKYLCLAAATLLLMTVVLACALQMGQETGAPFFLLIEADGKSEQICLWEDGNGAYYAFLPSYADFSEMKIRLNTTASVQLDGWTVTDGMSCEVFQPEAVYDLTYMAWGVEQRGTVVFLRSTNIAAMYIDTESGSMDFIHDKKGNEEAGTISVYTPEGTLDYAGELISINGRGNSTWTYFDKKPYSVKLSEEADLLGMGKAQKWILLANADDPSHLRNKLVYDFADRIGLAYSPDVQWVDVYLNDEYAGLYLLSERNELHTERIDISPTDSFVVSVDRANRLAAQNYTYVMTEQKQALRVQYPQDPSSEMLAELTDVWQSVENAITSEEGVDARSGKSWLDLIDLDSWVKKYLVEEVFANADGCFISQFFYYDGEEMDGKIYAGPVWDYDLILGAWTQMVPQSFYANRLHVIEGYDTPWFHCLYQKEEFYDRMTMEYETVFLPALEELLNTNIGEYIQQIENAVSMDHIRWSINSDGIDAEANDLTEYLEQRIDFLSKVWIEGVQYHTVTADQRSGKFYPYFAVYSGEPLGEIPDPASADSSVFAGWYYTETDEPVDFDRPITEDIEIYAKWETTRSAQIKQAVKLAPLGVIAFMGLALLAVDAWRIRKR